MYVKRCVEIRNDIQKIHFRSYRYDNFHSSFSSFVSPFCHIFRGIFCLFHATYLRDVYCSRKNFHKTKAVRLSTSTWKKKKSACTVPASGTHIALYFCFGPLYTLNHSFILSQTRARAHKRAREHTLCTGSLTCSHFFLYADRNTLFRSVRNTR